MTEIANPLPASTVILARPGPHGPFQVFLNRRPESMETYAGVYVFPGGRVETSDGSETMVALSRGLTPAEAKLDMNAALEPQVCFAHWVAAARELFEETGVHFFLQQGDNSSGGLPAEIARRLRQKRPALQRGEISLANLLNGEGLCCDVSGLKYLSHRVTPEHYAVRFDTRFYLAALPADQEPLHATEEVVESLWITPHAAVEGAASGAYRMMPPTIAVLRDLSRYRSWAELCQVFGLR